MRAATLLGTLLTGCIFRVCATHALTMTQKVTQCCTDFALCRKHKLRRLCWRSPKLEEDDLEPKPPPKSLEDTPVYFDSFCFACNRYSAKPESL